MPRSTHRGGIGSAPIEAQYLEAMKQVAEVIDGTLNGKERPSETGFVLIVFPFGESGRCNYISNAPREDVKTMLREQLAYFEGAPDDHVGHS